MVQLVMVNKQRYKLISKMIENLETKDFDSIMRDQELIPILFKGDPQFKELTRDVYPILKMVMKFNDPKVVSDFSFSNILMQKLSQAS